MSEFNKYSTDGGATFINVEDSNAVHWADEQVIGAVNLVVFTRRNGTTHGITYTINSDNSFNTSGTSNADTRDDIGYANLPAGTYRISGNTQTAYSRGIRIRVTKKSDETAIAWDDGSGAIFTLSETTTILIGLRYGNNVNFNDLSFSIMIALPSYTGGYVSGVMTNKELTENLNGLYIKSVEIPESGYITVNFVKYYPIMVFGQRNYLGIATNNNGSINVQRLAGNDSSLSIVADGTGNIKISNIVTGAGSFTVLIVAFKPFTIS